MHYSSEYSSFYHICKFNKLVFLFFQGSPISDDINIFCKIDSLADCLLLQTELDAFFAWTWQLNLPLNLDKCHSMTFCRKRSPLLPYYLGSSLLLRVHLLKVLGFYLSPTLSFKPLKCNCWEEPQDPRIHQTKLNPLYLRHLSPYPLLQPCMFHPRVWIGRLVYISGRWSIAPWTSTKSFIALWTHTSWLYHYPLHPQYPNSGLTP